MINELVMTVVFTCIFSCYFQVALATFTVYVLSSPEHVLDANKAFVSLSLFNLMNYPLSILPATIAFAVQVCYTMYHCLYHN